MQLSEEPIEEEEISPTRAGGLLGAIKNRLPGGKKNSLNENDINPKRIKGKLKKDDSITSMTSNSPIEPDSIQLEEIQQNTGKKKGKAPTITIDPAYENPAYDTIDHDDLHSISEASDSESEHEGATEA